MRNIRCSLLDWVLTQFKENQRRKPVERWVVILGKPIYPEADSNLE